MILLGLHLFGADGVLEIGETWKDVGDGQVVRAEINIIKLFFQKLWLRKINSHFWLVICMQLDKHE